MKDFNIRHEIELLKDLIEDYHTLQYYKDELEAYEKHLKTLERNSKPQPVKVHNCKLQIETYQVLYDDLLTNINKQKNENN